MERYSPSIFALEMYSDEMEDSGFTMLLVLWHHHQLQMWSKLDQLALVHLGNSWMNITHQHHQ